MNKTIELSTGKIVDLSRFVALIPDNETAENSQYSLILEGYSQSINLNLELDDLYNYLTFLPLTDEVMKEAANIWAEARIQDMPTADEKSLDADVIICAQYKLLELEYPGRYIVIATTNVDHLSRFAEAKEWNDISF